MWRAGTAHAEMSPSVPPVTITTALALALGVGGLYVEFGEMRVGPSDTACAASQNVMRGCLPRAPTVSHKFSVYHDGASHPLLSTDGQLLSVGTTDKCSVAYNACAAYVRNSCPHVTEIWKAWIAFLVLQFVGAWIAEFTELLVPLGRTAIGAQLALEVTALALTFSTFVLNIELIRGCNTGGTIPVAGQSAVYVFQTLAATDWSAFAVFVPCIVLTAVSISATMGKLRSSFKSGFSQLKNMLL